MTYNKVREQCSTRAEGNIKQRELQEGTVTWIHLNLLVHYEISKAFKINDSRRHEDNSELRKILLKEGGNATIMDNLQYKSKHVEHNCFSTLTESTELADFCLKNKEDHLQDGLNIYMQAWQDQGGTKGSLPTANNQNRRLFPNQQATKQQKHRSAWQPTLRALERLTWCVYERGNSKNGIFGQERRSQDSVLARRVFTEPTRLAPRSRVRQIFENG